MLIPTKRASLTAIGLSLVVIVIAGACSKESTQAAPATTETAAGTSKAPASSEQAREQGQALVRVIIAAPEMQGVDVFAANDKTFSNVDYKTVTAYKEVPASTDDFAIKPTGEAAAAPIAANSESISSGRHYTLIAFPAQDAGQKMELQVINDDLQPPSAGKARVRVVNASPEAPTIAVFMRGHKDALYSDVNFKEAASYKEVDPTRATLEFRTIQRNAGLMREPGPVATASEMANRARDGAADNGRGGDRNGSATDPHATTQVATQQVTLEPGKSYTIIVTGSHEGRSPTFETILVEDSLGVPTSTPTE
jgi:hypothetical protein